jgi:hypothetical protein
VCPSEYPGFGIERESMEITDVRATTVTVPLEAPLLHANGARWGRFVRAIVEVETDSVSADADCENGKLTFGMRLGSEQAITVRSSA